MLSRAIAVLAALQLSDMSLRTHVQGFLSHSLPLQVALRRASSEARSVSTRCVKAGCSTLLLIFDAMCVRLWCWWFRSEGLHTLVRSPSGSVHTAPNTAVWGTYLVDQLAQEQQQPSLFLFRLVSGCGSANTTTVACQKPPQQPALPLHTRCGDRRKCTSAEPSPRASSLRAH